MMVSFLEAWGEADKTKTTKDKDKHTKLKGACFTYMYITELSHMPFSHTLTSLHSKKMLPEVTALYEYQNKQSSMTSDCSNTVKSVNGPTCHPEPSPCPLLPPQVHLREMTQ
jgi:hypothetical protein